MRDLIPIDLTREKLTHIIEGRQMIVIHKPGLRLKPADREGNQDKQR